MSTTPHPTTLDDPRIQIPDIDLARIVAAVFTRIAIDHHDRTGCQTYQVARALRGYAVTDLAIKGRRSPAPAPGLKGLALTTLPAALRASGMSFSATKEEFRRRDRTCGADATLEIPFLCRLWPLELWPIVAHVITEGPGPGGARLEAWLFDSAADQVAPTRARPQGGPVSVETLHHRRAAVVRFLTVISNLRWTHSAGEARLRLWEAIPKIGRPDGGPTEVTETIAPPRHLVRAAFQRERRSVYDWLNSKPGDELAAIDRLSLTKIRHTGFLQLRRYAMFVVLVVLGCRIGAFSRLNRGDFRIDHTLPDGSIGPALRLTPGKTRDGQQPRWKPIPHGVADVLELYIGFLERRIGRPLTADDPLWAYSVSPGTRTLKRLKTSAIRNVFAGKKPRPKEAGQIALIPRDPENPHYGYTPHTYRSACAQMIDSLEGQRWLADRGEDAHSISVSEALLDHSDMKLDELGYHGAKKPRDRERLSALGTAIVWELLSTPTGARKQLDAESYRGLLRKRKALWEERSKWTTKRNRIRASASRHAAQGDLEEIIRASAQADQAADRIADISRHLVDVEGEMKELKLNPKRLVSIPDELDPRAIEPVDLDQVELEVNEGLSPYRARRLRPKRSVLAPSEFAELFDYGKSTVARWRRQGIPGRLYPQPFKRGVSPWVVYNGKRSGIHSDAINPALLTPERQKGLAELLASDPPEGWMRLDLGRPLVPGAEGE